MEDKITFQFVDGDGNVFDSLEIPVATDKPQSKKKPKTYLDESLIWDLHNVIESSDMFMSEEPLKHKYNLFCAFKDRMFSAVKYLNEHSNSPKSEEEFINFLVYAAIVRDGIMKLYENLYGENPPFIGEKKYFLGVRTYSAKYFSEETQPTDDDFFEYLRAMAFAHPYETSKRGRPFMEDGEIQMCPWVIIDKSGMSYRIKNPVGIRIYSNKFEDDLQDILFSFDDVKAYIKSRYKCLKEITKWAKEELEKHIEEWKKIKINRNQDPVDILTEIKSVLTDRFLDASSIENLVVYLTCPISVEENRENVLKFRQAIIDVISAICDSVDNLDCESMEQIVGKLFAYPRKMHQMAHYQLEKIFSYLNERNETIDPYSNEAWGLKQAQDFANGFAKKWVKIDVDTMQYDEIKLLVNTACYLERKEQESGE